MQLELMEELVEFQLCCLRDDNDSFSNMVNNGADINLQSKGKVIPDATPLHLAIRGNSLQVFMKLLECRTIDVNRQDQWGFTPLHYATFARNKDMVKHLLSKGAATGITTKRGSSALEIAAALNYNEISDILNSRAAIDSDPNYPAFRDWLVHLGAGEYISNFMDAGYDLRFIAKNGISDDDLDCVGIPSSKLGLRRKIKSLHDLSNFISEENSAADEDNSGSDSENNSGSES